MRRVVLIAGRELQNEQPCAGGGGSPLSPAPTGGRRSFFSLRAPRSVCLAAHVASTKKKPRVSTDLNPLSKQSTLFHPDMLCLILTDQMTSVCFF